MKVHRLGEFRFGWEVSLVPVEYRLVASWSLLLVFSKCSTPSIFIIWWANIWWGSGAIVVIFMTGLARDQSNAFVAHEFRLGSFLALAFVGNQDRGGFTGSGP